MDRTMAELMGKESGYCKGRSGSMHLARVEDGGIYVSSSIVGAGIPIAAGLGLAIKFQRTDQVVVCFFGDGASNQGTFHEGINIAAIWSLPVLYVCENNGYAVLTPATYSMKVKNVSERGAAYGIPGITVDGTDVMEVYEAADKAIQRLRVGGGPILMECMTNRFRPHSQGVKEHRPSSEIEQMNSQCPINKLRSKLIDAKVLTQQADDEIQSRVLEEIEDAVRFAKESKDPDLEEVSSYVYA